MEYIIIIIAILLLILLLSFRQDWVIITLPPKSLPPLTQQPKNPIIIPQQNEVVPSSQCIHKNCAISTFGCCDNGIQAKYDSIGTNCLSS